MRSFPHSFGSPRVPVDDIKREGWCQQGILVVSIADSRLTWPEKEFLCQLGEKLYGKSVMPMMNNRRKND
jgi:hypothetical protein